MTQKNAAGQYISTTAIAEAIEEIRQSGDFNMFDYNGVLNRAWEDGHTELAEFMMEIGGEGWGRVVILGLDTSADTSP